jgi:hypothetical protein
MTTPTEEMRLNHAARIAFDAGHEAEAGAYLVIAALERATRFARMMVLPAIDSADVAFCYQEMEDAMSPIANAVKGILPDVEYDAEGPCFYELNGGVLTVSEVLDRITARVVAP